MPEAMKMQEMFDKAVAHLKDQNKQCVDENGECIYHQDGFSCVIGCFIPLEMNPENVSPKELIEEYEKFNFLIPSDFSSVTKGYDFLGDLQLIHDDINARSKETVHPYEDVWVDKLYTMAKNWKLDFTP